MSATGLTDMMPTAEKLADIRECRYMSGQYFRQSATDKNVCRLRGGADRHKSRHCTVATAGVTTFAAAAMTTLLPPLLTLFG
jgi:hypothetical protein